MSYCKEDVVIAGLGGLYPKVLHLEAFEKLLFEKEDHFGTRWKEGERGVCNKIGTMPDIEFFDAAFFGIHRTQVTYMDPMHRLILERTFEAICDAGVNPLDIRGKKIGVYMGSSIGENDNLFYESIASGFGVTGHSRAMMANRVSYWLNLRGPSCAYDSNWLNGFDVIQLAYNAIKEGQIEGAIVGTANLNLNSEISFLYNDLNLLSPDGVTRSFDEKADGYGRSDGVVVLYITKASLARRSYCTILNVLTEYNGDRDGPYLNHHGPGIAKFMNKFYSKCGVDPSEVEYLEAYGCALPHIDEMELNAVDEVYCKNRKDPLKVGCVKSNVGHAEASCAMLGVSKAIIIMESGYIPGDKSFETPNPNIPGLANGKMNIITEKTKFDGGLIAVNGFGISSSSGHILLRPNKKVKEEVKDDSPKLYIVSTRTEEGIKSLLDDIIAQDIYDPEYVGLTHKLFSKAISGHLYRGYCVLDKQAEAKQEFEYIPGNKRPIWFVYSGMGSQWNGMGRDLMQLPIFAESIHRSAEILKKKGVDLMKILTDEDKTIFDNILHSFVGIAAVQIALTNVLKALGIVPDGIIGHSVGELGCAYADDCFTDEQMILCSYSRGKASLEANLIKGMMAAVGLGYNQIKDMVPPSIEVACHNGSDSSTISGPTEDMETFVKQLQDKGIFARLVNVSNIAYHSKYIKPAAPFLLKYLQEVVPHPKLRSSKWISTSAPENIWDTDAAKYCSAQYHTNNLLGSVLFEEGSKHIPKDSIVIEIAPHGLLQAILKRSLKPGCTNIPLTNRASKNGLQFLFGAIGKMYLAGIDLDPSCIYPPIEFPVSRGTKSLTPLVRWEHGEAWRTGLEEKMNFFVSVREVPISLNSPEFRDCVGHQLDEKVIFPISYILNLVIEILKSTGVKDISDIIFQNLRFENFVPIPKIGSVPLYIMIQKGTGKFEILSGDEIVASGTVTIPNAGDNVLSKVDEIHVNEEECVQLSGADIYTELCHRGHVYGGKFKSIKQLNLIESGSVSTMAWQDDWGALLDGMLQQYIFHKGEKYQKIMMPTSISRVAIAIGSLPKEDAKELTVTYNFATGILSADGIRISGVHSNPLSLDRKPYTFDSIEFVPFRNVKLENVDNMINYCFNLTLDNFHDPFSTNIQVAEIETKNPSFMNNIRSVLSTYGNLLANVSSVKESNIGTIVSQSDPLLVVINGHINDELAKLLINSHAFALCMTDDKISKYPDIVEFAHYIIDDVQYSLIRKVSTSKPTVVRVKGDVLSAKDIARGSSWVTDLQTAIANSADKKVYLVSSIVPIEGVVNFVRDLRSNIDFASVRCVFLMDKNLPEFQINHAHYAKLLKQDPFMAVYKDGINGSYIFTAIDFKKNLQTVTNNSNLVKDTTVEYIGINLLDETKTPKPNQKNELGNIDYGGTTKSGDSVIGLARFDYDTSEFILDPILKWTVPISISVQNAVTIPHAYATAYHSLIQIGRLEAGETVLIHAGCTAIGMACIAIATSMNCTVFTTVADDNQKSFLLRTFNSLVERNILSSQNSSFEPKLLLATGGVGAHVIVNFLSDDLLQASTRCIADCGRILQIGKLDMKENNSIGMRMFLKNTSFASVLPEDMFNMPEESKRELHKLVEDGIDNFIARPIKKEIVCDQSIDVILAKLKKNEFIGKIIVKLSEKLSLYQVINYSMKFICDSKGSHLIYGGTAEIWADMAEWLILHGARKIVVTSDSTPQSNCINRRLSLLQTYFQANIVYAPNKTSTKDAAADLLNEVVKLGSLKGVYLLPNKNQNYKASELKSLQYIDMAMRNIAPKTPAINFVSHAAGLFQMRYELGYPTYNIQWQNTLDFHKALSVLDYILNMTSKNVFIKDENVSDSEQETKQVLYKKLTLILPNSLEELKVQVRKASTTPEFVQLMSQGPRTTRELPPIFIIPGLSSFDNIKDMAKELLHPVFCAKLPTIKYSIKKIADVLAQKIVEIFPRGPYNLLGISCGGPLTIEISRILEKTAKKTQITFIDGAPDTIQSALNYLGEGVQSELNFLTKILNINNNDVVKTLQSLPNWEARMIYGIDHCNCTDDEKLSLKEAISTMRQYLSDIAEYKPSDALIAAEISLIKPLGSSKHDNCGLPKYCKEAINIHIINGDHISMMRNKDISDIINDNVIIL